MAPPKSSDRTSKKAIRKKELEAICFQRYLGYPPDDIQRQSEELTTDRRTALP
jgi:hypothetical protein